MAAGQYQDAAVTAANKYGVPVNMFLWQIGQESGWDPNARNPKSTATGIAQFTEGTAKDFNLNPLDPYASLDAAAKYDAQLLQKWGSWESALTHYGTLHDASPETMAAFKESLGKESTDNGLWGDVKELFNYSMLGMGAEAVRGMQGEETPTVDKLKKFMTSSTILILGVVVIVVAILSNKTVQTIAVTAVTKGKK